MSATEIRLLGQLGKRFGRSHRAHLDTKTPAEAMRWLLANFPDARQYFAGASDRGMEFAVFRGRGKHRENIGFEQLREPGSDCISFCPVFSGSKNGGVLTTIVGAVLIVIGAIGMFTPFGQAFGGAAWGPYAMNMGIAMAAGGVVQLLTAQPRVNKGGADSADNQASYIFNGPINTTAQGGCVPVLYGGPMEIGSTVISAGIEAVDYSSRQSNIGPGTPLGGSKKSPYDEDPA
jgi:predicted phage tail protein